MRVFGRWRRKKKKNENPQERKRRQLRVEPLEQRVMLAGDSPEFVEPDMVTPKIQFDFTPYTGQPDFDNQAIAGYGRRFKNVKIKESGLGPTGTDINGNGNKTDELERNIYLFKANTASELVRFTEY